MKESRPRRPEESFKLRRRRSKKDVGRPESLRRRFATRPPGHEPTAPHRR